MVARPSMLRVRCFPSPFPLLFLLISSLAGPSERGRCRVGGHLAWRERSDLAVAFGDLEVWVDPPYESAV